MQFNKLKGLTKVKESLIRGAATENIAHAMLFAGKPGAPALPLALAYATYLNCEKREKDDSCGTCPSCSKNNKYIHPDLHFVYPVNTTSKVAKKDDAVSTAFIPEWRGFLKENIYGNVEDWANFLGTDKQVQISRQESREIIKKLSLKSFEGRYKIMIIWLPELMHPAAANGILKILEEPPENTIFLLVTNQEDRLLTTITSRTQRMYIPLFTDGELINILHEDYQVPEGQARQLAQLAEGSLSEALRLSHQSVNDHEQMFINWMRNCYRHDFPAMVTMADEFHMLNKLSQKSFMQYALNMMRESLLVNAHADDLSRTTGETMTFMQNFSKTLTPEKAQDIIPLINEGFQHLERNASAKMMFLDVSISIAKIIK